MPSRRPPPPGAPAIGENYAQELLDQGRGGAGDAGVAVHFIGQSAVEQGAPRRRRGRRLGDASTGRRSSTRWPAGRRARRCSCRSTRRVSPARAAVRRTRWRRWSPRAGAPGLRVDGLMTVGPTEGGPEAARPASAWCAGWSTSSASAACSMGMSDDLEVAVEEGATAGPRWAPRCSARGSDTTPVRGSIRPGEIASRRGGTPDVILEEDHGLPGSRSRRRVRRRRRSRTTGARRRGRVGRMTPTDPTSDRQRARRPTESGDRRFVRAVPARPRFPSRDFESRARRRDSRRPTTPACQPAAARPVEPVAAHHVAGQRRADTVRPRRFDQAQEVADVQGRPAGDHEPRGDRPRGRPPPDRLRQRSLLRGSTARWRRWRRACTC